jgi:hypothetical protein
VVRLVPSLTSLFCLGSVGGRERGVAASISHGSMVVQSWQTVGLTEGVSAVMWWLD